MKPVHSLCLVAVWLSTVASPAVAQAVSPDNAQGRIGDALPDPLPPRVPEVLPSRTQEGGAREYDVAFEADAIEYDTETEIVTASGDVRMARDGNRLRAGKIVWNRKTGQVVASGNVEITSPAGDKAYGDSVDLTDTLKDGVVDNLLIVLIDGGRLAATSAVRKGGITDLNRAAYSPCVVVKENGCPKEPVWKITAVRVRYDPARNRISYRGARLELFGVPLVVLPGLSHPANNAGGSGLLVPNIQVSRSNGLEFWVPAYLKVAENRDLTLTPHIFSGALPAIEAKYRALTTQGAYQVGGYFTYSAKLPPGVINANATRAFRGYFEGNGKFQLTPDWSVRSSVRLVTDRTFLRRYDFSRDDLLRSTIDAERVTPDSYLSISGWGFQTLRSDTRQGQVPVVFPLVDYRRRLDENLLGGRLDLQLNSLAIGRSSGQDTQRAFAGARWDLRRIIGTGQEVVLTGYARGDVYHTAQSSLTNTALYRGDDGWHARGIATAAAEVRWPLIGTAFGGVQQLTPRLQVVASPPISNLNVPNEDARAVELEDSNLFALNRFPGYDRWEDGTRVTYGVDWQLSRPGLLIDATIGQSYRLSAKPSLFVEGTGLTDRLSDIVGRATIKYRRYLSFTFRYRIDKDNLAVRRGEIDATFGTPNTYATISYLRLNRDVSLDIEDLRDREEVRLGGRIQFRKFWSIYGSAIVDLTGRAEDRLTAADGFEPVRHRLGIAYEDDCLRIDASWRRDYATLGDAERGNIYQLRLSFRNLGR